MTGYGRARADWVSWPDQTTKIRRVDLNQWDQAIYDLKNLTFNVKDYGAVGDGVTDDTAAISAAMTDCAAAGAGIITFPGLVYKFSTLPAVTTPMTLAGTGWMSQIAQNFGDAAWASGHTGTVLKSTATSGNAIAGGSGSRLQLRDLMLVGPGSGTSAGVKLSNTRGGVFSNVRVSNFSIGWDLDLCLCSTFLNPQSIGCATGFRLNNLSNQNTFVNASVEFSTADAILIGDVSASNGNSFYGGLCEDISGTSAIRVAAGKFNHFDGFWFENVTATNSVVFAVGAGGCTHRNGYYSANVTDLAKTAADDTILGPFFSVTAAKNVTIDSGAYRVVLDHLGGTNSGNPGTIVNNSGTDTGLFVNTRLSGTATWDPPSIADGAVATTFVTVNGAAAGDTAIAAHTQMGAATGSFLAATVNGANSVTVVLFNKTGAPLDIASGTLRVEVWKH